MLTKDFLLEIGTEEIPAGYLNDAAKYISDTFNTFLTTSRLTAEQVTTTFTPRRLSLLVYGLQVSQADLTQVKLGPNVKIAYKEDGSLAPAAEGFLRSSKADKADVFVQTTEKGDFIAVQINQAGLPTEQLLRTWIESLLTGIPFPKKMKWGSGALEFARPVRWLTVLWDKDILPIDFNGLQSGRRSFGNRYLGLEKTVDVPTPKEYYEALKTVCVIADRHERFANIKQQLEHIFDGQDYRVDINEGLLQTVTDLIESPTAVVAEFDSRYLILPSKIITSTISTNQKYFAVNDLAGNLTNKFVFISNGNPEHSHLIRLGNQKVVTPRLEDALWYYHEDTKQPLEHYVNKLKDVVFQAKLGTIYDKTQRIILLSDFISECLKLTVEEKKLVNRTALLCKADLVTNMLGEKEFTKLQGYIGKYYALASGEDKAVAEGIFEHYLPKGQNDELPETIVGAIVALADKMDTVCGIISAGMLPTGSADPYALRRAANGVVQIIARHKMQLSLSEVILKSYSMFGSILPEYQVSSIDNFYTQRIKWYLQQEGFDYDVIESIINVDYFCISHLVDRANALQMFKQRSDFVQLVIGFKRVSNIIKDCLVTQSPDFKLMNHIAETELFEAIRALNKTIFNQITYSVPDYNKLLDDLLTIRPAIDRFFDDVLVNTDDESVRQNRYALLSAIRSAFLQVADLSLLVVEGDKK